MSGPSRSITMMLLSCSIENHKERARKVSVKVTHGYLFWAWAYHAGILNTSWHEALPGLHHLLDDDWKSSIMRGPGPGSRQIKKA
jgi:hypothetical protein